MAPQSKFGAWCGWLKPKKLECLVGPAVGVNYDGAYFSPGSFTFETGEEGVDLLYIFSTSTPPSWYATVYWLFFLVF